MLSVFFLSFVSFLAIQDASVGSNKILRPQARSDRFELSETKMAPGQHASDLRMGIPGIFVAGKRLHSCG